MGVIWGEGHIKNPGSMSTQRASQVGMLPVKKKSEQMTDLHLIKPLCCKTQVHLFRRSQSRSFRLNSHVIYFDVTVVGGCDQQLGVRGECEGSDRHGVTCREGNQSVCIKYCSLTLKSTAVILDLAVYYGILLCCCFCQN